ncbi:MAG: GAF domain-containing protein [Myxococcota bacterium]|jgi:GAF domain-containing protein
MTESERWEETQLRIAGLLDGESDGIAMMATVACELHHAFDHVHWVGFYRVTAPELLVIGPYQGAHGCLRIPFDKGVCGAAARTKSTQRVADVTTFPGHISCSSSTQSELVVPICTPDGQVLAVLDLDSDTLDAFTDADQRNVEALCADLGARWEKN